MSLVLTVAVVNVGLGFALAVMLGRRYRAITEAIDERAAWDWEATLATPAAAIDPPRPDPPEAEPKAAETPRPKVARSETPEAKTVNRLQTCVVDFGGHLDEADDRLRSAAQSPNIEAIEACLASLRSATEQYLSCRLDAETGMIQVQAAIADEPTFEVYQAAVRRQDAEIEQAQHRYGPIEPTDEESLAKQCGELVAEASRLIDVNHQLRDALETVDVGLRRTKGTLDDVAQAHERDEMTGLLTRAAIEATLQQMWAKDRHRVRSLCVGLLDIDQMGSLNQAQGHRKGNDVLRAVARVVQAEQRDEIVVGRFAGARFCVLFPDVDLRVATNLIERLRQSLELTRFVHGDSEIRLTVSCGVVESTSEDSPRSLFGRAEATLREAKRYGRNRTFLHEGKYPAPVIPPNFTIEERVNVL